jgi:hypothetical protein
MRAASAAAICWWPALSGGRQLTAAVDLPATD